MFQTRALAPLLAGSGVAVLIALWAARWAPESPIARWPGWAAAALAVAAVGLLDDPARQPAAASPTPLALRWGVRLAVGLPVLGLAWLSVVVLATTGGEGPFGPAARAGLTLQAAALVILTLGVGAALVRRGLEERARLPAMVVPLVLTSASALLPDRLALMAMPGSPAWDPSLGRWTALFAAGAVALAWASRAD
jgi:hypothetical protein